MFDAHHFGGAYHQRVLSEAGISARRSFFVPYSVDTPHFSALADDPSQIAEACQIRQRLGWSAASPVLLFLAQHSWVKGPDIMLDIAAIGQRTMPDLKLIMAGNGVMTEHLKTQAGLKLRPGSWHFPGFVSSKKTVPWYLASDLVVFPSRYDTWSRAVNEAMLCRRACQVSHLVGAAGGLVDDGVNGMVVQGLEPNHHAESMLSYLRAPWDFRRRFGDEARNRALEFSYENHSNDLRRSFIETATNPTSRTAAQKHRFD
ncbi:MAG: glycosyltransferase family 4 protein [Verrucomicrobiales bacterium]|nr:glycosyltransferase family 4 protein [Verrucomicrobiales bacterium]